jgi:hypothetical protein
MTELTFEPWPKIPRLNRDCVITEKIDGTNAAVLIIKPEGDPNLALENAPRNSKVVVTNGAGAPDYEGSAVYYVGAQSRNRLIQPGDDNFAFAQWVWSNAAKLVDALGEGRHFGEWWGSGIMRGYGLPKGEKRFSLFNVHRYRDVNFTGIPGAGLVPVLSTGAFRTEHVAEVVTNLSREGSHAAPGFMRPEGVIVFHSAAQQVFKVTCEKDDAPKGKTA